MSRTAVAPPPGQPGLFDLAEPEPPPLPVKQPKQRRPRYHPPRPRRHPDRLAEPCDPKCLVCGHLEGRGLCVPRCAVVCRHTAQADRVEVCLVTTRVTARLVGGPFDIRIIVWDAADMASERDKQAALAALKAARDKRKEVDGQVTQAVVDARAAGVKWREIADELGLLQPNATRKYKPAVDGMKPTGWDAPADPESPVAEAGPDKAQAADVRERALAGLRKAAAAARKIEEGADAVELRLVAEARTEGATWAEIGEQLGMLATNATAKFGPRLSRRVVVRGDGPV